MDHPLGLPSHVYDDALTLSLIALFIALVIPPPILFGLARRIGREQPHLAGGALAAAALVALFAIAAVAFIVLVLVGWIPPVSWGARGA